MLPHSFHRKPDQEPCSSSDPTDIVDYRWFSQHFEHLLERFSAIENALTVMEQNVLAAEALPNLPTSRDYYSVAEFADQVERGEYTVREWCRLARINAEKCETGRGDAKSWKIPAEELQRYRDHGLLTARYLR